MPRPGEGRSNLLEEKEHLTRDQLLGVASSFFRARHVKTPRFKSGRRKDVVVSHHNQWCKMVSWYFSRVRALGRKEEEDK